MFMVETGDASETRISNSMSDSITGNAVPRQAVAGIVRSDDGRVLLVRRNPELKFMGGMYAFPGGSVDAGDHDGPEPAADGVASVDAMALARELFEETGLLIARGSLPSPDERRKARQRPRTLCRHSQKHFRMCRLIQPSSSKI